MSSRSIGNRSRRTEKGRNYDEEEEEEEDSQPVNSSNRSSQKKRSIETDDEEDEDEEAGSRISFSQIEPEATQEILAVIPREQANFENLSSEQREKAVADLSRRVLFAALAQEPINRVKFVKDLPDKIASAVFGECSRRLHHVFGWHLQRAPAWILKAKGLPKKYKDYYYAVNTTATEDTRTLFGRDGAEGQIARGLLMVILALAYCKGQPRSDGTRWIHDTDLYSLLNSIDENIPSEPPASGSKKKRTGVTRSNKSTMTTTPNVDNLLQEFCDKDYLVKLKAVEVIPDFHDSDAHVYTMGPRAATEIGRKQLVYFCAEILDVEPDPSMLAEIEESNEEPEEDEWNV
jgi:hypothetical protein